MTTATIENVIATNNAMVDLITNFSKSNKVGKAKVESLVIECLNAMPEQTKEAKQKGRPLTEKSIAVRQFIIDEAGKGGVTSSDVAKQFDMKPVQVNVHFRKLEQSGIITRGAEPVRSGTVGKPSILWVLAEKTTENV